MTCSDRRGPRDRDRPAMPDDRRRLIEIDDAIASIRTQIATADLARQRGAQADRPRLVPPRRTALRHLSASAPSCCSVAAPSAAARALKDAIIGVLRERHDTRAWDAVLAEAQVRSRRGGRCDGRASRPPHPDA